MVYCSNNAALSLTNFIVYLLYGFRITSLLDVWTLTRSGIFIIVPYVINTKTITLPKECDKTIHGTIEFRRVTR